MAGMDRHLTKDERAAIERILAEGRFDGARELRAQVESAKVIGGVPSLLDLQVSANAEAAAIDDGPLPIRAFVDSSSGLWERFSFGSQEAICRVLSKRGFRTRLLQRCPRRIAYESLNDPALHRFGTRRR